MSGATPEPKAASPGRNREPATEGASGLNHREPETLVISHWFDPGASGESYSARIRLTGRRVGIGGKPGPRDTFVQDETVADIVPGSGRMSISTWVYGLEPGDWIVTAVMTRPHGHIVGRPRLDRWKRPIETLPRARWSWRRWAVSSALDSAVQTRWSLPAPLARIPAVLPGSFPALGTLGILVALMTQAAIVAEEQLSIGSSLLVSVLALVAGLIAAKIWYAILHPGPWRLSLAGGWSVMDSSSSRRWRRSPRCSSSTCRSVHFSTP